MSVDHIGDKQSPVLWRTNLDFVHIKRISANRILKEYHTIATIMVSKAIENKLSWDAFEQFSRSLH